MCVFFGLLVLFEKTTLSFNFDCCLCFSGVYTFRSFVFFLFSFAFHVSRNKYISILGWNLFACLRLKICATPNKYLSTLGWNLLRIPRTLLLYIFHSNATRSRAVEDGGFQYSPVVQYLIYTSVKHETSAENCFAIRWQSHYTY